MEDPWSSPWATDPAAASQVTLDLPSEPAQAHFGNSPRRVSRTPSPWSRNGDDEEEGWGGWNAGKDSPGWGRSPALKAENSRLATPDPWALGEGEKRGADSAISMGDGLSTGLGINHAEDKIADIIELNGAAETTEREAQSMRAHSDSSGLEEDQRGRSESPVLDGALTALSDKLPDGDRQLSKVQELVEMYDDMARGKSVETLVVAAKNSSDARTEPHSADTPDGEENLDETHLAIQEEVHEPKVVEVTTTDEEELENADGDAVGEPDGNIATSDIESEEAIPTAKLTSPKPDSTVYPIDLSVLDKLFPGTETANPQAEFIPDTPIGDTFASVAERKAWYRISRFGSMRKHNHGDDETYVRVGWNSSQVRHDTLATVRRWMEEDSLGGRVVLGRRLRQGAGSMFNWDSSAPPVEIGELLAKKKKRHSRQGSASAQAPMISPIAASFGWSTSVPSSPESTVPRQSLEQRPKLASLAERPLSMSTLEPPPSAKTSIALESPVALGTAVNLPQDGQGDEDDDWGEMVSSPTVDNPTFGMDDVVQPPVVAVEDTETLIKPQAHNLKYDEHANPWGSLGLLAGTASPAPVDEPALSGLTDPDVSSQSISPVVSRLASKDIQSPGDEEAVDSILRGLPDVSYMLR